MSRLIDADALMEDINGSINEMTNVGIMVDGDWLWAKLNDALDNAPTVEERKTGEWIEKPKEEYQTFDECVCSNCGVVEYFNNGWKRFNYCPNCGARMET